MAARSQSVPAATRRGTPLPRGTATRRCRTDSRRPRQQSRQARRRPSGPSRPRVMRSASTCDYSPTSDATSTVDSPPRGRMLVRSRRKTPDNWRPSGTCDHPHSSRFALHMPQAHTRRGSDVSAGRCDQVRSIGAVRVIRSTCPTCRPRATRPHSRVLPLQVGQAKRACLAHPPHPPGAADPLRGPPDVVQDPNRLAAPQKSANVFVVGSSSTCPPGPSAMILAS